MSPDGKHSLILRKNRVEVWRLRDGELMQVLVHDDRVYSGQFSQDGAWIVSASLDSTVRVWDAFTGEERLRIPHPKEVLCAGGRSDGLGCRAKRGFWLWKNERLSSVQTDPPLASSDARVDTDTVSGEDPRVLVGG